MFSARVGDIATMAKHLYKIIFHNQDKVYEIFAERFAESDIFGFIEVDSIVFGDASSLVVDPSEERLRNEFGEVKRFFVPVHSIIRIDEVAKEGSAKIKDVKNSPATITPFPYNSRKRPESS